MIWLSAWRWETLWINMHVSINFPYIILQKPVIIYFTREYKYTIYELQWLQIEVIDVSVSTDNFNKFDVWIIMNLWKLGYLSCLPKFNKNEQYYRYNFFSQPLSSKFYRFWSRSITDFTLLPAINTMSSKQVWNFL